MFDSPLFVEIWASADDFKTDYKASGLYDAVISPTVNYHNSLSDANISLLYYLLLGKYGNNPISNASDEMFKNKVYSIIFQYGPTWQKKLKLQDEVRNLSMEEMQQGAKMIYNHAYADAGEPTTDSLIETSYIDDQSTQNNKKSKVSAYNELLLLLETNVTEEFINRFKVCFKNMITCQTFAFDAEE